MGIILRCLPPEVLAADISQFEASGAAATEIGLPMNMILGQLPSGKVEMTLQELVPHFPPGYLHPVEALGSYLPMLVSLPLMDVVMRIPPDLLALRPDQKDVDASVINMADPFTEEILREQAEAAKREGKTANIIDESQVPGTEEFVPRDQAAAAKSFVPPPRPRFDIPPIAEAPIPQPVIRAAVTAPVPIPIPRPVGLPPAPSVVRASSPVPPPAPNATSRRISPSGKLPIPIRPTSPRPQAAPTVPVSIPNSIPAVPQGGRPLAPPIPGGPLPVTVPLPPRQSAPIPQTPQPPLRQSARIFPPSTPPSASAPVPVPVPVPVTIPLPTPVTIPLPVPVTIPLPTPAAAASPVPVPVPQPPAVPRPLAVPQSSVPAAKPSFPQPGQPDAAADELKRLAALAMQEMGEDAPKPTKTASATLPSGKLPAPGIVAEAPSIPPPPPPTPLESGRLPAMTQTRSLLSRSINAPVSAAAAPAPNPAAREKEPEPARGNEPSVAFNLNNCGVADLVKIPGCSQFLAESIVRHRTRIGSFKKIEDLLEVPGMNSAAYSNLTGEQAPQSGIPQSLSDLLGFPPDQKITLKDVTDRICCWPDVTGCILGQSTGLPLVGSVPKEFDKAAIVAFAPRMFESINKSFGEIAGKEANELIIPTTGTSFHIFRNGELYLIILARLPQMPDRHIKIARLVLAGLNLQPA
jgi:predicted regulator of Ras-like GTPase activity (Roadblock/LC7/MglB family)